MNETNFTNLGGKDIEIRAAERLVTVTFNGSTENVELGAFSSGRLVQIGPGPEYRFERADFGPSLTPTSPKAASPAPSTPQRPA